MASIHSGYAESGTQHQANSQQSGQEVEMSELPVSILRLICQQMAHVDIEQARLTCTKWSTAFGAAAVTDMYLAMCADFERAKQLAQSFSKAFNWHHLHFWIPGGPVREMMGTHGGTFSQYMELFSQLSIKALTLHYLDNSICPLSDITSLRSV